MSKRNRKRSSRKPRQKVNVAAAPKAADLSEEYSYVIQDLTRIGIIAAILIGALVVLSIIL